MLVEALVKELEQESDTTRRVLERVPSNRLGWKPHPKSMTIGGLAMHIALTPGFITDWALQDSVEVLDGAPPLQAESTAEILAAHDESVRKAKATLARLGDAELQREWRMTAKDGTTLFGWAQDGSRPIVRPQPSLSPPRPAGCVSQIVERAGAIDLRTKRG